MKEQNVLSLEEFLPYRLTRLTDVISRDFSVGYRTKFGLTRPEWRTLATIGQFGRMTATEVGAHSSMHKTKVSRAVATLERRRWLVRETSSKDRRVEYLSLTRSGKQAYEEMVPEARAFQHTLLNRMQADERTALLSGLNALERAVLAE